jgi:CheY-like chemotaxis protein
MTTALVIDDNRETADSIAAMLTFLNVENQVAYGPRAAMMVLQEYTPDIIFLDISMPGVDGFEVMGYLHRFPQLQNVPVVFVTADTQPETAGKVRKAGAKHMIIKPITLDGLEAALQKAGFS